MSAELSDCGQYRYNLRREPLSPMHHQKGPALFCMLNPSTADASSDDPTIRRCRRFAESWGYAGILVVNVYALRSTDPAALRTHADPVGPLNDHWLRQAARDAGMVVCAWGTNADASRVASVVRVFESAGARLVCLGKTKDGHPRHPLYVRGDQPLMDWSPWSGK